MCDGLCRGQGSSWGGCAGRGRLKRGFICWLKKLGLLGGTWKSRLTFVIAADVVVVWSAKMHIVVIVTGL